MTSFTEQESDLLCAITTTARDMGIHPRRLSEIMTRFSEICVNSLETVKDHPEYGKIDNRDK